MIRGITTFCCLAAAAALVSRPRALPSARGVSLRAAQREIMTAKYSVAVIGGGPAGACAAEICAEEKGIDTFIFERKMDNAKPCGGAIPLCMVDEFDLPSDIIDRKVRRMKMISPTNREVDIGQTLKPHEYIGMTRREILDGYLRDRAIEKGATAVNALVTNIKTPEETGNGKYLLQYQEYEGGKSVGVAKEMEVDVLIGADGTLELPGARSSFIKASDGRRRADLLPVALGRCQLSRRQGHRCRRVQLRHRLPGAHQDQR